MKICGIIVEYNPFHNGHIYHIEQARKLTQCDLLIAIMSGHFTQRGEPAIIDKWKRTEAALMHGVDLVIELPFNYACQSADYFAKGAITILNALNVNTIVFGSESNDVNNLINIAKTIAQNEIQYNNLIHDYMKLGNRYPSACNLALKDLLGQEIKLPNDLLGLSYVKEIIFNNYNIQPLTIQRTNQFHELVLSNNIASATSIRNAIKTKADVSNFTPISTQLTQSPVNLDMYFDLLYYKLMLDQNQLNTHLVTEGINQLMKKKIIDSTSMNDFINKMTSKRYTISRIQRSIISILINQPSKIYPIDYIRILGMTQQARPFLNSIKKISPIKIISNFSNIKSPLLDLELKSTILYASVLPINIRKQLIEREYKGHPIIK